MTVVKLSDRQRYALLALADAGDLTGGLRLSVLMTEAGRETSTAGAHQAASNLAAKGLAVKDNDSGVMRYKLTGTGRALAAQIRGQVSDGG